MTTSISAPVVDADGHVLEPADTWLKYLEPVVPGPRHPHRPGRARLRGAPHRRPAAQDAARPARRARRHRDGHHAAAHARADDLRRGEPGRRLRSRRAAARHGRRGDRRRAALSHHRHLLGRARHRRRARHGVHARLQPLAGRLLPHRPQAALPGRPHLAARSRGRGAGDDPRAARRLRRHLPLAGPGRPRRPALRRPGLRAVLGDGPGARDADRLSRGRARSPVVPAVAAPRSLRRAVRHRVPGHRRDGGVHADAQPPGCSSATRA